MWGVFMFGVLKIEERKTGLINRIKYIFNKPQPLLEKVTVKNGAPFFAVTIFENTDGTIDYNEIYRILGRCAKRLVISRDTDFTETRDVGLFRPSLLPYLLLFNSGVKLSKKYTEEQQTNKLTLGIIDLDGILKERIIPLVQIFANIKIITDNPLNFEPVCDKILSEWGLPIIITDNENGVADCDFILSPFIIPNSVFSNCCAIRNSENGALTRFSGEGVTLPPEYSQLIPENTDPLIFASALFELCGVNSLSDMSFDKMKKI